jgi:hypothetical protein
LRSRRVADSPARRLLSLGTDRVIGSGQFEFPELAGRGRAGSRRAKCRSGRSSSIDARPLPPNACVRPSGGGLCAAKCCAGTVDELAQETLTPPNSILASAIYLRSLDASVASRASRGHRLDITPVVDRNLDYLAARLKNPRKWLAVAHGGNRARTGCDRNKGDLPSALDSGSLSRAQSMPPVWSPFKVPCCIKTAVYVIAPPTERWDIQLICQQLIQFIDGAPVKMSRPRNVG